MIRRSVDEKDVEGRGGIHHVRRRNAGHLAEGIPMADVMNANAVKIRRIDRSVRETRDDHRRDRIHRVRVRASSTVTNSVTRTR
jgi:hypothetical protein